MKKFFAKIRSDKRVFIAILALVGAILASVIAVLFTGDITVTMDDDSLQVQASFVSGIDVPFEELDSVEFREKLDVGSRQSGFGSPRLSVGYYENEEFGLYTLYAYTKADAVVVVTSGQKVLVLSCRTEADTLQLFEALQQHIG